VLEMAESSADKGEYERKIAERFGLEQQSEFTDPNASTADTAGCPLR
jgi:hypothetical protein